MEVALWLSTSSVSARLSLSVTVTRAGRFAGATALIAGSSVTCTRWRSAAVAGSWTAESSSAAWPAPPRTTIAAAACGSDYFDAKWFGGSGLRITDAKR